jgi:uncharacterized protein (DUF885 family)
LLNRRQMLATSAAALTLPATAADTTSAAAIRANALYDAFMDETMALNPEVATNLGLDTGARDALRYKLTDYSLGGRDKAKAARGSRFDIRDFHDALLVSGALPLDVLGQVIDAYNAG